MFFCFFVFSYLYVLERSETARKKCGEMFVKLMRMKTISLDCYLKETEEILSLADELRIDIPKLWDCLAETIGKYLKQFTERLFQLCISNMKLEIAAIQMVTKYWSIRRYFVLCWQQLFFDMFAI